MEEPFLKYSRKLFFETWLLYCIDSVVCLGVVLGSAALVTIRREKMETIPHL